MSHTGLWDPRQIAQMLEDHDAKKAAAQVVTAPPVETPRMQAYYVTSPDGRDQMICVRTPEVLHDMLKDKTSRIRRVTMRPMSRREQAECRIDMMLATGRIR